MFLEKREVGFPGQVTKAPILRKDGPRNGARDPATEFYAAIPYEGRRVELKVSSHAMCMASEVWKNMLEHPMLPQVEKMSSQREWL